MKKNIRIILCLIVAFTISQQIQAEQLYEMTNQQIDELLTDVSSQNLTITERINKYSELFLGMPYNIKCAGDGKDALYETWQLVNFKETNCMVFCEHVLAMSISDSWDNFFNNLQQIRYKNGMIGMRTRNHYTMGDWLPENSWLLDDVTKIVGEKYAKPTTRTISHKTFFQGKGISDLRYVQKDREMTIHYVPIKDLLKIKHNVKTGDILALIFANKDNIFSAHMLMIAEKNGKIYIRESSSSKMTTFDTEYDEWVNKTKKSKRYVGLVFMRVKDELDKPGKIILPWEIKDLK